MSWIETKREITKEDYEAIKSDKKSKREFFTEAELMGYGAIPTRVYERDGRYFIDYGISDCCD